MYRLGIDSSSSMKSVDIWEFDVCVIVDTNVAASVFRPHPSSDFQPLFDWLTAAKQDGVLVFGGRLASELRQDNRAWRFLIALEKAGRAHRAVDQDVASHEASLRSTGICTSDDPHVLALARVSGARVLCSLDTRLHADFKNPKIIADPRGVVYKRASHRKLLKHTRGCVGDRRKARR